MRSKLVLQAPAQIALRHTVGLADRLTDAEPGNDPKDGLPATLEAAIERYGLRYFKLKLCGQLGADIERLHGIALLLDRRAGDYRVTLDGNETFADAASVSRFWRALKQQPRLHNLVHRTLLIEQPLPRQVALHEPIAQLQIDVPVILDESDDHAEAFEIGLTLGYRGISSKACKGLYRSLRNAVLVAQAPLQRLLSGEDLTCQAGLAVQQDTLLAASLGIAHIERNGHHYVDGFGIAPPAEAQGFADAHAGFYDSSSDRPRLAVRDGLLDLQSLHVAGFASAAMPHWDSLQRID